MLNLFKKKTEEISRTTPGYEEAERRAPVVGIVLLILMFVIGISFGLYAMNDLASIPDKPADLSRCAFAYRTDKDTARALVDYKRPTYYEEDMIRSLAYEDSRDCVIKLSDLEQTGGIAALYERRIAIEQQMSPIVSEYVKVTNQIDEIRRQLSKTTGAYSVGLQEQQAGIEQPVFPTAPEQQSIEQLRQRENALVERVAGLQKQVDTLRPSLSAIDKELVVAYRLIFKTYDREMRWYEFKVFLLQFLLIIPFFFFALRKYLELHRKNSPYTIILTAIVAVLGVLLLKTTLFWFWGLFLERILRVLIEWFERYHLLRSLLFYLGMFLSFVIFGGAVYLLQKRIFDPRRVTIRRFRAKQCPQCQTNLDLAGMYCPNCGAHTREVCQKCGKERFIGLPFCPQCGDKRIERNM